MNRDLLVDVRNAQGSIVTSIAQKSARLVGLMDIINSRQVEINLCTDEAEKLRAFLRRAKLAQEEVGSLIRLLEQENS